MGRRTFETHFIGGADLIMWSAEIIIKIDSGLQNSTMFGAIFD